MAKISGYNVDTDVSKTDLLIGTDSSSGTKNFQLQDIADFLNKSSLLNVNGQVIYKFEASTNAPSAGTFVISGGGANGTNLSTITHLIFHHLNSNQNNIAQYLNYFNGSFVMLTQTDDQNTFALYSATVSSNTANQTDFYLTFIEGNGVITENKHYALSYSPKGQTDKTFVSNEISFTANNPVTINHNLNKFPSVTTVDTTGAHIIGDVQHINTNSFKITFNVPFSAKVYAN